MFAWRLGRNQITDLRLLSGMFLPLLMGFALFGWRALGTIALVIIGAHAARWFLARLRSWPASIDAISLTIRSVLIAMFLPAGLFDVDRSLLTTHAFWPMAVAVGITHTLLTWSFARIGTRRFSATLLTALLALMSINQLITSNRVLQRDHVFRGDLLSERVADRLPSTAEPWLDSKPVHGVEALSTDPASRQLSEYLRRHNTANRRTMTIPRLLSDSLPPMEDLVIGGHPTALGNGSILAVVIGGLLLVYRGMVAFRVPALILITTFATLIIAPIPVIISPEENVMRWLAGNDVRVGWAAGLTFINYVLFASPTFLVLFFFACQPTIRPSSGTPAGLFAIIFGVLCALSLLYVSIDYGPVLALAATQIIAPTLQYRLSPSSVATMRTQAIVKG